MHKQDDLDSEEINWNSTAGNRIKKISITNYAELALIVTDFKLSNFSAKRKKERK